MWLIKMAWLNMWRNRGRTLITMAAIFFAVVLSVLTSSLQEGVFNNLVKNVVSFYTGYVQVHQKGYWDDQVLDNGFKSSPGTENIILANKNITALAARLESFALASSLDITRGSLVVGIDPTEENKVTLLQDKMIQGTYLSGQDAAVLLAQGLADRLKLKTGDTVVLIGQGYHGSTAAAKYPVKGLIRFGSPDLNDKILFMPLATAQQFYGADGILTSYILSLKNTEEVKLTAQEVGTALGNNFESMSWEEILPDIKQHIKADTENIRYIQAILYMLICFGIFGTLLMMMVERKFELGMLLAVGMKKTRLALLLLYESVFTVLAGCILGILASIPLVYYLNRHPLKFGGDTARAFERFGFEAIFPTSTNSAIFINQGLVVMLIGLLLSIYPLYKISRLNPVTAMKR